MDGNTTNRRYRPAARNPNQMIPFGQYRTQAPARAAHVMALAIVALACGAGCARNSTGPQTETVTIAGEQFELELAIDLPTRTRGLMHRTYIPADGGMLFVFPRPEAQAFWMANCLVDIDCIFLDPQGLVTAVHEMKVEPPRVRTESEFAYQTRLPRYSSESPSLFCIELRAGSIDQLGIKPQQKIDLDLAWLKALPN